MTDSSPSQRSGTTHSRDLDLEDYVEPQYQIKELLEIGRDYPHASFESWQSLAEKLETNSDRPSLIKDTDYEPSGARSTEEAQADWDRFQAEHTPDNYQGSNQPMLTNIEEKLNDVVIAKPTISRLLLLGMGSPHDRKHGKAAVIQYAQARDLIQHCLNKLALSYGNAYFDDFVHTSTPEIVCDSSQWYDRDVAFVGQRMCSGGLELCTFKYAPLNHIVPIVDSPSVFVFIFNPDNPVRQMVADMTNQSTTIPRAILCAEAANDLPSRDEGIFEPDRSSEAVVDFFDQYVGAECAGFPDLAPGMTPWLYVDRRSLGLNHGDADASLPASESSAGAGADDGESSAAASTSDSQATESAESRVERSSQAGSTSGSDGSGVSLPALKSWWSLEERDDDYLYKS